MKLNINWGSVVDSIVQGCITLLLTFCASLGAGLLAALIVCHEVGLL